MRKDFIVPVDQQINIPVQQGPMETRQDLLKNGSAHCVTLGCIAKEQVQLVQSSDLYQLLVIYLSKISFCANSCRLKLVMYTRNN